MIQHKTGKTVKLWDGTRYVDQEEVVTFQTVEQRDKAIAADKSIAKVEDQ